MNQGSKSAASIACRVLLRSLASIFLKCGLTWKEFSELSKSAFVQAATEEYGINGRPTNVSRTSILTGISRKEIKRQRDLLLSNDPIPKSKTTDATRVLSGWFQDAEFLGADGKPKLLSEDGAHSSFVTLCDRYSGDIAMQTMLKELLQTGTIERTPSGQLQVMRPFYRPAKHDDENLNWGVQMIRDLADTMNNNIFLSDGAGPRFGRKAESVAIPQGKVREFHQYLDGRGQAFLEDIDAWLTDNEMSNSAGTASMVRLGVGTFAIEEKLSKEQEK